MLCLVSDAAFQTAAADSKVTGKWKRYAWAMGTAICASVVLLLGFLLLYPSAPTAETARFLIYPPENSRFNLLGPEAGPAVVSPDGKKVAFVATTTVRRTLWVRSLDSVPPEQLSGTEGAMCPFWSPDSQFVAYFVPGKLKKIPVSGGPSRTLCDATNGRGGAWNRDGTIVFTPQINDSLYRVPAMGGRVTRLSALDQTRGETGHRFPYFLPDGKHFLFVARSTREENTGIYWGSLDSKSVKRLLDDNSNAIYAPPGYLLFVREGALMAQSFDPTVLELRGEATPLAENVGHTPVGSYGVFSASENGTLVYGSGSLALNDLSWFDRDGKLLGKLETDGATPRLAPDHQRVALSRNDPQSGASDIWIYELARKVRTRLTFDPKHAFVPVWSPDGLRVIFGSNRNGSGDLYRPLSTAGPRKRSIGRFCVKRFYRRSGKNHSKRSSWKCRLLAKTRILNVYKT